MTVNELKNRISFVGYPGYGRFSYSVRKRGKDVLVVIEDAEVHDKITSPEPQSTYTLKEALMYIWTRA